MEGEVKDGMRIRRLTGFKYHSGQNTGLLFFTCTHIYTCRTSLEALR